MVSELAGEEATPPQLPAPASRSLETAQPLVNLRSIRSGSLLRRGLTTPKSSFELWRNFDARILKRHNRPSVAVGGGGGFKASKHDPSFNSSRVLIKHRFKAFSCSSWSKFVKNSSKMLVYSLFAGFNQNLRSIFAERMSAELVDPSPVAVPGVDPWKSRAHCSKIVNDSSSRSMDSWCRVIVVVSSPQRRTKEMIAVLVHPSAVAIPGADPMEWKLSRGAVAEIDPLLPPQPNFAVKKHLRSKPSRGIRTHSSATSEFQSDILQESSDLDSMSFLMLCFVLDLRCLSPPLPCEHVAVIEACAVYAEIIKTDNQYIFNMQDNLLKAASVFPLLNSHGDHLSPLFSSASSLKGLPAKAGNGIALVVCASKGSNNKPLTGVIFEPFEEVKKELSMVPSGPQTSLCRQKFVDDCEAAINEQINVEYNVALKGLAKFFKESSEEERDHAEKLMEYQNKRGGKVKLHNSVMEQCIVMPLSEFDDAEKGDALYAMELALSLEKLVNEKLLNFHAVICIHLGDDVNVSVTTMTNNLSSPPSVLSFAAELRKGNERVAKFFENDLEKVGADIDSDVNSRNYCGQTALMQACRFGHWKVVQNLFLFRHNVTRASRLSSLSF